MIADDEWDIPTDVNPPTWIAAAEQARQEQAALASIEREQMRELAVAPMVQLPPRGSRRT